MKTRTITWIVEQELTYKDLKSPEGTPSEWWQIPNIRPLTAVDTVMMAADAWQKRHPDRQIRIVEIEEVRTSYTRKGDGHYTQGG
jgi:hypothetical protein